MSNRFDAKVVRDGCGIRHRRSNRRGFSAESASVVLVDRNKQKLDKVSKSLSADRTM
jgi:hypothetical protein